MDFLKKLHILFFLHKTHHLAVRKMWLTKNEEVVVWSWSFLIICIVFLPTPIFQQLALESVRTEYANAQLECNAADERAKVLAAEVILLEDKVLSYILVCFLSNVANQPNLLSGIIILTLFIVFECSLFWAMFFWSMLLYYTLSTLSPRGVTGSQQQIKV